MHGRIANLAKGFVTQDVEYSKWTLASPWRNLRLRAIGFGKAMDVRRAGRIMALLIPSERSAEGPSQREESSNREVRMGTPVAEQDRTRVLDGATGAPAGEWNRPDVMERHVAEKRVAAQVEPLKVAWLHAHAHDQFSPEATLGSLESRIKPER
jgi:hypothetical protein